MDAVKLGQQTLVWSNNGPIVRNGLTSLIKVQAGRCHNSGRRDVRKESRDNGELVGEEDSHGGWFVDKDSGKLLVAGVARKELLPGRISRFSSECESYRKAACDSYAGRRWL
jgi:hypothetical protein